MSYWPLLGVAWVIAGFALRRNPVLVVVSAGVVTGLLAGMSPLAVLELLGGAFVKNRFLLLFLLTLPVIALLERHGLRQHAQRTVARLRGASAGRLLVMYLALRQLTSALGLNSLAGHAQTVRPLLAPMAEGLAQVRHGALGNEQRQRLRAAAAATDNVGMFFGEDIFLAFGGVLLMQAFLAEHGYPLEPLTIALWGIPTALCAFAIHATRMLALDRRLARDSETLRRAAAAASIDHATARSGPNA
ncbi:MAG: DUF969 domain-containing protein [Xanthomonadaceae bacterium]|nr:DUF969 domain-containing protein [Xanthomonadaceae bacterium]